MLASALLAGCHARAEQGSGDFGAAASVASVSSAPIAALNGERAAELGCHDNQGCAAGEFCAFSPGLCGKGQAPGKCRPKPAGCAKSYEPVCACSGKVYDNACAARAAGDDLDVMGQCKQAIPDYAACGAHYCDARKSYCEIYLSDVFDLPTDHFCRPLPEACKSHSGRKPGCDCFPKDTLCLGFCGPLATGGVDTFHLTCQGRHPPPDRVNAE